MGAVKITPADAAFSKCVRERSAWRCDRCGTYYPEGKRMGLHCSHYFGRGSYATRFDPLNAFSHCYGCHQYMGSNPHEFDAWAASQWPYGTAVILAERRRDTFSAKLVKKNLPEVAKHYREEHKRMVALREQGEQGRIEFVGWL